MDIDRRLHEAGQRWRESQGPALQPPDLASLGEDAPPRQWRKALAPMAAAAAVAAIIFGFVSVNGATTGAPQLPAGSLTTPVPSVSSTSTEPSTSAARRAAAAAAAAEAARARAAAEAAVYLQSFLASWQKDGLNAAGQKYLDPSMRADQTQGNLVLIAGTVTSTQPSTALGGWVSADHFTVIANFDLRFSGNFGAWGNGVSSRFVTFVRSSAAAPYQITFATGP
ncbi:MAG: hypothetical protein HHJ11_01530 [Phycicoccus sp.]|nr:hypothetical protein [Phycicoccus sp.]